MMKLCSACDEPATHSAPCYHANGVELCDCGGTGLTLFCVKHYDLIIGRMKQWAKGTSTEKRRRGALEYFRRHPEL